jgi:hypothetical protein
MTKKIDFIGIGAQKSGTTWIAECLREHPDIIYPEDKEYFFFNRQPCFLFNDENLSNFSRGIDWYLDQFPQTKEGQITGEFATNYYNDPKAAEEIKKFFPQVKLLVILRNPIDMIYSLYWYGKAAIRTRMPRTFERFVKQGDYLERGLYFKHLRQFYQLFPKKNIHVILLDEVKNEPKKVVKTLYKYLEVDPSFTPSIITKKSNPALKSRFSLIKDTSYLILNFLSRIGLEKQARNLITNDFIYQIYKLINLTRRKNPPMKPKIRKRLIKYYQEDTTQLEKLIKRDLSTWKK